MNRPAETAVWVALVVLAAVLAAPAAASADLAGEARHPLSVAVGPSLFVPTHVTADLADVSVGVHMRGGYTLGPRLEGLVFLGWVPVARLASAPNIVDVSFLDIDLGVRYVIWRPGYARVFAEALVGRHTAEVGLDLPPDPDNPDPLDLPGTQASVGGRAGVGADYAITGALSVGAAVSVRSAEIDDQFAGAVVVESWLSWRP